ncbi:MAG: hypothetical protein ED859_16890 [Desulfuromonadales bacterium]|nr:MAG: hypothetical protein ED859_16890 [Desulfuromonadales bacterium]
MTRPKTKPPIRKPVFDEATALRFAAASASATTDVPAPPAAAASPGAPADAAGDPDRVSVTLHLKRETIARIQGESARKGKSLAQVVDKLVAKHLSKH